MQWPSTASIKRSPADAYLSSRLHDKGHEMYSFNEFISSEDGAVTVDWVVLTAAIVGLGLAVLTSVGGGTTTLAGKVSSSLGGAEVTQLGTLGF